MSGKKSMEMGRSCMRACPGSRPLEMRGMMLTKVNEDENLSRCDVEKL